ncbi:MAG: pyridoxal-5'-phosphate-dependent protein beta subunit [Acidobacteria bacterium]|nr:MAG: pyridoxal-5'-phosphate-dependent protein beta subunit [Acidobacteriota bacterium]
MQAPSWEDARKAREVVSRALHRTPLVGSETLSRLTGHRVQLKLENLQKTGSFKPRGALNHMAALSPEAKVRGVITISAGNHAQGVAYAAKVLGLSATVVMPESASPTKAEAARGYGAEVILHGDVAAAFAKVRELERDRGLHFVHPFDDPRVVAGQATLGMEIVEDLPDLDAVLVGIGGGGLISGVAWAVKELRPGARVIGVEPEGADTMHRSRREGKPARLEKTTTIADGLAAPFAGELNFCLVERYVDELVRVTDSEIVMAMRLLFERCKTVAEPAGAAALGALLARKISLNPESRVCCVISGGNVGADALASLFSLPA